MKIEQFTFRPARSCRGRRLSTEEVRFEVVKETKQDHFDPILRQYYEGTFTYRQKVALEALSEKVNDERKKIGIL